MYFTSLGISSSDIGGAIAEAILHDIRLNTLDLRGFPQIYIEKKSDENFQVTLEFDGKKQNILITAFEAKHSVKMMKAAKGYDPAIFDRIQEALSKLEGE